MSDLSETLRAHGGVAHLSTLRRLGVDEQQLRKLTLSQALLRPRQGWYALPGAPPDSIRAATLGGQITCVSALKAWGVWCVDDRKLHVSVARNASGMPSGRQGLTLHYSGPSQTRTFDDIVHALAHTFGCQSRENVIVSLNSALNKGLIAPNQLATIRRLIAAKYWPYLDVVDGGCESGLETKCVLRLRALNIKFRTQVYILGVGRVDVLVGDRLVLELDGIGFHSGEFVKRDRRRDLALHRLGYIVLRVDYGMVMDQWAEVEAVILAYVSRKEHRWSERHVRAGLASARA